MGSEGSLAWDEAAGYRTIPTTTLSHTTTQTSVERTAGVLKVTQRSGIAHAWGHLPDCAILSITDGPVAQLDRAVPS